jgi:hypothetical protein
MTTRQLPGPGRLVLTDEVISHEQQSIVCVRWDRFTLSEPDPKPGHW